MGTSVLAMPWAFSEAGLAGAILLCLINGPIAAFTAILVDQLHKKANRSKFPQKDSIFALRNYRNISSHSRRRCQRIRACLRALRRRSAQIRGEHRVFRSCNWCSYCLPPIDWRFWTFHRKIFLLWVLNVRLQIFLLLLYLYTASIFPRFFINNLQFTQHTKITKNTTNNKIWDWASSRWVLSSRSRVGFVGGGDTVRDRTPLPGVPQTPQFFITESELPRLPQTSYSVLVRFSVKGSVKNLHALSSVI